MMTKLYEVTLTAYVVADSEEEARAIVEYRGDFDNSMCDIDIIETTSAAVTWWDAYPFGGDGSQTVGQIVEAMREQARQTAVSKDQLVLPGLVLEGNN